MQHTTQLATRTTYDISHHNYHTCSDGHLTSFTIIIYVPHYHINTFTCKCHLLTTGDD